MGNVGRSETFDFSRTGGFTPTQFETDTFIDSSSRIFLTDTRVSNISTFSSEIIETRNTFESEKIHGDNIQCG